MQNLPERHLHIVCHDVPYPVNHGGIFDPFYKIVALSRQGIKIHLHCFEYGRGRQDELDKYCEEVIYYKRQRGIQSFSFRLPYIVNSRRNKELLANLIKDDHPVLLEGIHCTYFLSQNKLAQKKVFVRLHNVESEYYRQLAASSSPGIRKLFFLNESRLLENYEIKIAAKTKFLAVNIKDAAVYKRALPAADVSYLPVFVPFTSVEAKKGKGSYCLYHGNLAISENERAVEWLLKNVFNTLSIPFIIAGKQPGKKLDRLIRLNPNSCLIANPTDPQLNELIAKAHINVLPSFNSTGIKIKLLHALFSGRHCLVNPAAVDGTGLEALCHIAADAGSFAKNISTLSKRLFTNDIKEVRRKALLQEYDNAKNARRFIQWVY